MPDIFDVMKNRRSIRRFLEVPVDWEPIGNILEAGRMAPTAGNIQDVRFVVILDPGTREKIAEACFQQYWMSKAPVFIVIGTDPTKTEQFYGKRGVEVYTSQNASAAAMSMVFAAEAQGLATCWVSAFEEHALKGIIGMPDNCQVHCVLPIGYADEKPKEPLKFSIETLVYFNSWGNRFLHMTDLTGEYSIQVEAALKKGKDIIEKAKKHLQRV